MATLLLIALFWGFCCAVIGVAVVGVFANEDIPNRLYFGLVQDWHERGGWWALVGSPIGGCVACTSGQLGLWSFSIVRAWGWRFDWAWGDPPALDVDWAATFLHLLAGCAAVLCAFTINKAYRWLNNKM